MDKKINPYALIASIMALGIYPRYKKETIDELSMHLKLSKRTLEQEYKLVKYKISSLSRRLRNQVIYRYENQGE